MRRSTRIHRFIALSLFLDLLPCIWQAENSTAFYATTLQIFLDVELSETEISFGSLAETLRWLLVDALRREPVSA
ncbi:hypothetical protein PsYK624_140320 [Phanerochaete sordida]|uniref:Secreted protein n=1 Tax=Phanerochaete sordida TaxID=48140 RepID=A0A9P3LJX7_9APHY|nr:hypothetical protein PsYK624_140320 [Phanerochaete sordida]